MYTTFDEKDYYRWLAHVGVDHIKGNPGSGRYEWGSGKNPYQRADFNYQDYSDLKKAGMSEKDIAEHFNIVDRDGKPYIQGLRNEISIAKEYDKMKKMRTATELYNSGITSSTKIAKQMGIPESTVRSLLDESKSANDTKRAITNISDILSDEVDKKGVVDITSGTELVLGVTSTRYKAAIQGCENAGYKTYILYQDQLGNNKQQTTIKVLAKPDMEYKDVIKYMQEAKIGIAGIDIHTEDNGLTFYAIEHPRSVDSNRVMVAYDKSKDGLIEIRRGVDDISLGDNHYAQVRIAVDGTHYIKGMCVYSDNLPNGIDIRVNSNKKPGTPLISDDPENCCLKPMKRTKDGSIDYDNPFGATIKMKDGVTVGQSHYVDKDGKTQLNCVNIINEEGDWSTWKKHLASQMLSKQSMDLINQQFDISKESKKKEFDEINQVTNPTIRKSLLYAFADECDKVAIDLDAAAMPRQASHAILPVSTLKDNEIYAPNYRNGERVVLIRYPHAGDFEIPELIVNNRNKEAQQMMGKATDAVGITQKTAAKLSGADFDGDSVLVIPNNRGQIHVNNSLKFKELQDFDTNIYYKKGYEVTEDTKQKWMGITTNLLQDMTLKGAPAEDLIPAVKFTMVIIDAQKHNLDWKQAYEDYKIADLNVKYRGRANAGASTVVTRAGSDLYVNNRRPARSNKELGIVNGIDIKTGKKVYEETGKTRIVYDRDKVTGEKINIREKLVQDKISKMEFYDDAYALVGNKEDPKERAYADYANYMKNLANESRRIAVNTENMHRNPEAAKTYAKEVAEINDHLKAIKNNSYLERQAQMLANKRYFAAKNNGSVEYTKKELKRLKNECLAGARLSVGAKRPKITITPRQWEAIEAGAISSNILTSLMNVVPSDIIRTYAMPHASQRSQLTYTQEATIRAMANRPGVTQAEIADVLGISTSTVNKVLNES